MYVRCYLLSHVTLINFAPCHRNFYLVKFASIFYAISKSKLDYLGNMNNPLAQSVKFFVLSG